jgi:hypothetical protein
MIPAMKRSLVTVAAVGAVLLLLLSGVLVSGCGRGARHERGRPAPVGGTVPSTAPSRGPGNGGPAGGADPAPAPSGTGVDPQLGEVDGLLGQLDGQLGSDDAAPGDAD